jgi:hypothetical protein
MEKTKRRRGRPRKIVVEKKEENKEEEKNNNREEEKDENKEEENIVLFLALSSDEDEDDEENNNINNESELNKFTINETETKKRKIDSITDSSDNTIDTINSDNYNNKTINKLIEEIKKRDIIIANLKSRKIGLSSHTATKKYDIDYHSITLSNIDSNKRIIPKKTEISCWWCDYTFDNFPVYIPNSYKNNIYYVFGNFCSFNCAAKYNRKMLNDHKCDTRYSLLCNLKYKITGDSSPIKLAEDRELLKSKGGKYTINNFRKSFNMISLDRKIDMPPMIPLVHSIVEAVRD